MAPQAQKNMPHTIKWISIIVPQYNNASAIIFPRSTHCKWAGYPNTFLIQVFFAQYPLNSARFWIHEMTLYYSTRSRSFCMLIRPGSCYTLRASALTLAYGIFCQLSKNATIGHAGTQYPHHGLLRFPRVRKRWIGPLSRPHRCASPSFPVAECCTKSTRMA